jgi:phosphatidylinositol alpha-1,6-mannosyltransferase
MVSQIYNTATCADNSVFRAQECCEADSHPSELLLFAFEYPPVSGGISRLCSEIAGHLHRDESRIKVLTQQSTTPVTASALREIRVGAKRPLREWQAFRWLQKLIQKNETAGQATICGIWYPEGLIAYLAGVRSLVILAHGAELLPRSSRWLQPLWSLLQRRVLESAQLVIANSEYTGELATRVAPKANVQAIPLAVDTNRFTPGDREAAKAKFGLADKRVVCTVSRIHRYKGHDVVLHAIAKLSSEERKDLVYLIAGQGPYEQELKDLAVTLGIDRQIRWLGFVPEKDLTEIYRASDLFVLCTREAPEERAVEGFGMVFLEAQASGVPVVGTKTGGIPDAIRDGEGGWLIDQDDAGKLADILRQLVRDPDIFRAAGIQARQRVLRECTWQSYGQRFYAALQRVNISI